jgi:hypothetical protein
MPARVPQDVDLEDKLIYGLSPVRFGYLVLAVLGALSLWRQEALPSALRLVACLMLAGAGATLAWGGWRGRPADHWLVDAAVFVGRNYRLQRPRGARPRHRAAARRPVPTVVVSLSAVNALAEAPDPTVDARGETSDLPPAA